MHIGRTIISGMPRKRRAASRLSAAILLIATGTSLTGCHHGSKLAAPDAPGFTAEGNRILIPTGSPLRRRLAIGTATDASLAQNIVAPASIEADPAHQAKILTPLTGRILQLYVRLGDHVRAGQPLALLSSPDLATAAADDTRARAQLRLAQATHDRALGLKGIGGGAAKDVEQAQADLASAQAEAARAAERLQQVGATAKARHGGTLLLTAPFSGAITDLAASPGAFWTDATASLMTVTDISRVWVTAHVAEGAIGAIRLGQPVTIAFTAYPGETVQAQVASIGATLDPDTRRTPVRIALPNDNGRFKPGMFATATFPTPAHSKPTVPDTALILKDDATIVYVEVRPWVFEPRPVDTGTEQNGRTVIENGLTAGQRLILQGGVLLND